MKRLTCFILALILAKGLPVTPRFAGAQDYSHALEGPAETLERDSFLPGQEIDESTWIFPNFGWQKNPQPNQVFLAFPQDNGYFALGSVITLGWQPVHEPSLHISHYEIVVKNAVTLRDMIARTGFVDESTVTTYLFRPKTPGKYFWTVRAVTEDGMAIPAMGRYLNVFE